MTAGLAPEIAALILGTAGCSPYLKSLLEKEIAWWPGALEAPEAAMAAVLAEVDEMAPDALGAGLRQAKRRVALLTGLADLGGVWSLEEVTAALTRFADAATHAAFRATVGAEIRRGKLPGATEQDAQTAGGLTALAMGKMGAFELNYSSDIDLICLFDETRFERDHYGEARQSLVRATRKACALLSDTTAEGYVFRTDLRLRPDPAVTPVVLAMEAAERYYESLGRTWERAAYVKARPCAGDIAAGERFLRDLTPFVWRRHLDFAAIQDAHDMRLRIRDHKGGHGRGVGPISLRGHNMKLGRGGIREIEFFTQTQQIIAGGRDPSLRLRGTVDSLRALTAAGWVPEAVSERLILRYRQHREVEHRLQMINDAQTHDLPQNDSGFARLAAFMGVEERAMRAELGAALTEVHDLIEGFFVPDQPGPEGAETGSAGEVPKLHDILPNEVVGRWMNYPALRSQRACTIFGRLRDRLVEQLADSARPEEALQAFDGFLKGLPAGVQVFSLFEARPQLLDLLVEICAVSPELGAFLSRNSSVLDAVIAGDFFADWPGTAALREGLAARMAREDGYEARLDLARRWAKEWHFRIGVHHLRGMIDAETAGRHYAELAEAVIAALWPEVIAQFARRHGPPPGRGAAVLAMGSLGAGRISAKSDLDLIVIYDPEDEGESTGPKPLSARVYYARLTQAFVTALTARMAQGKLYEVDMRLRPSGSQGPVAASWASFRNYQRDEAWTWEHLALTRARGVAGSEALGADIESLREEVLSAPRAQAKVLHDLEEMRVRLAAAKSPAGPLDPKPGPGRAQDIELFAQAATLLAGKPSRRTPAGLIAAARLSLIDLPEAEELQETYALCVALQISLRLLANTAVSPEELGLGARRFLLSQTGDADLAGLQARFAKRTERAAEILEQALARAAKSASTTPDFET
ncbi:glutamate-ammonia-ligase adenylyltransferase [Poseidonocella sedimentorum]|uniref:Glutamate-ammonia-ligase adenylyltransferase n=2 Tax=Poseidonocella sedimentorum TaxID=871652 RepID=A0A1I6DF71_9RHOB|nr:glutamate-ammonia-ligase adenylyltransferase [Poseidonocella sedimentorum]